MLFFIFITILIIPYTILMLYYRKVWVEIKIFEEKTDSVKPLPFLSVIIPARNESQRIGPCLNALENQTYPADLFEVIVVNDFSEDDTADIVLNFSKEHKNVSLINLSDFVKVSALNSYKKKALETGISKSHSRWIVTTDADCVSNREWLTTIGQCIVLEYPSMIAGPVKYDISGSKNHFQKLLFIFQAIDFMTLQGITGGAVSRKLHYMANGANLAYNKEVYLEINGFEGIDKLASGDDMFLMEKFGFRRKIFYLKSTRAIVSTQPEPTIAGFINQRVRWAGKSIAYRSMKIKWILGLVYAVNACMAVLAISSVFITGLWKYLLVFFIIKIISELWFLFPVSKFFNQQTLLWLFIFFQPFHIIYVIIAGWFGSFGTYRWKGRKVR